MDVLNSDRLPCIHVSDLLKPCDRYVIYSKIFPPEFNSTNAEDIKSLVFGQMVHHEIKLDKENNEIPLVYNWVWNTLANTFDINSKPNWDILAGTIDDLVYVKGEPIICDKKTTGSIDYFKKFGKPSDSHREQINYYRVLLKKCLNIDAKWGANIYINNCISPDEKKKDIPVVIIPYKLDDEEKTEKKMMERCQVIKDYMTKKIIPPPTYNFLCDKYCNFATRCFEETETKFK